MSLCSSLNSPIIKSADLAACLPSFPLIPTPTCAATIILTSFAPSPIDRVRQFSTPCCTILTIWAFYLGETLQQITDLLLNMILANNSFKSSSFSIVMRASPVITIEKGYIFMCNFFITYCICTFNSPKSKDFKTISICSYYRRLQE